MVRLPMLVAFRMFIASSDSCLMRFVRMSSFAQGIGTAEGALLSQIDVARSSVHGGDGRRSDVVACDYLAPSNSGGMTGFCGRPGRRKRFTVVGVFVC